MTKLITKRNIAILNLVLLAVFLITLVAVGVAFVRSEPMPSLFSETEGGRQKAAAPQEKAVERYVCPKHPEVRSASPGKCPKCGSELEDVYSVIARRDLFNAHLRLAKVVEAPPPQPLQWELVGISKIGPDYVAVIRDRSKRVGGGFAEYIVREGEEVAGYFGVTVVSITPEPAAVKYNRVGVGVEELKMGQAVQPTAGRQQGQWSEIIRPVPGRVGYLYVVRYKELQQRVPSAEAYMGTFGLEQNMQGTRANGLKITRLTRDNLLYAAGLRQGDVVQTINGKVITDEASALAQLRSGASRFGIQLGIMRGRTKRSLSYTLYKK